ncbi:hypothetical protein [Moraxella lacunata]|uniref:hypothetical protein n=1 Tax=Moraxella lacunata TaxID=477 RepID=UPI003EE3EC8D
MHILNIFNLAKQSSFLPSSFKFPPKFAMITLYNQEQPHDPFSNPTTTPSRHWTGRFYLVR